MSVKYLALVYCIGVITSEFFFLICPWAHAKAWETVLSYFGLSESTTVPCL